MCAAATDSAVLEIEVGAVQFMGLRWGLFAFMQVFVCISTIGDDFDACICA